MKELVLDELECYKQLKFIVDHYASSLNFASKVQFKDDNFCTSFESFVIYSDRRFDEFLIQVFLKFRIDIPVLELSHSWIGFKSEILIRKIDFNNIDTILHTYSIKIYRELVMMSTFGKAWLDIEGLIKGTAPLSFDERDYFYNKSIQDLLKEKGIEI